MKVLLFCGGKGTRIREASELLPKPLIRVCNLPIILRLMARYSAVGANDFILATGHLSYVIIDYCLDEHRLAIGGRNSIVS